MLGTGLSVSRHYFILLCYLCCRRKVISEPGKVHLVLGPAVCGQGKSWCHTGDLASPRGSSQRFLSQNPSGGPGVSILSSRDNQCWFATVLKNSPAQTQREDYSPASEEGSSCQSVYPRNSLANGNSTLAVRLLTKQGRILCVPGRWWVELGKCFLYLSNQLPHL